MSTPNEEYEYEHEQEAEEAGLNQHGLAQGPVPASLVSTAQANEASPHTGSGAPQVAQQNMQFIEETGRWTYTDDEGVSFEYDENLKAWFPMFNEELIQAQQSAYGETVPDSLESVYAENAKRQPKRNKNEIDYTGSLYHNSAANTPEDLEDALNLASIPGQGEISIKPNKKQKGNNHGKGGERKPKPISSVFVTGLPLDTDVDEIVDVFKKGGVFMEDEKGAPKIKLYTDKDGRRNGEALVTYLRHESVPLAIDLLDDTEYRAGVQRGRIRVQQAQFKEKERPADAAEGSTAGAETKTKTKPLTDDQKKKVQKKYQKLEKKLDWFEDDENLVKADKWNKVCILKHMFTIQELETDPTLLLDLKEDIREECEKCGEVTNVIIYDHNPEGVVSVRFKDKESAELCVRLMSGRYFAGQKVVAEIYDGHTRYESQKTKEELEEEEKQRLDRYAKWLEAEEEATKKEKQQEATGTSDSGPGSEDVRIAADAPTP